MTKKQPRPDETIILTGFTFYKNILFFLYSIIRQQPSLAAISSAVCLISLRRNISLRDFS